MKKVLSLVFSILMVMTVCLTGCGSSDTGSTDSASVSTDSVTQETDVVEEETEEPEEIEGAIPDGVYLASFDTDSSMFHVNETCDGKGTLTVEGGKMTIHITLVSKNIVNLYLGLAEDAQKDGAEIIEPTVDTVTYDDGMTEEVYGFDVEVPALDEEFDLALIGTKGKWYDHKVSVSSDVSPVSE